MQIRHQFPNGLTLIYLQTPNDPISACHLFLPYGSAHEPHDKGGMTTLMWALLNKGTENKSGREMAEEIESMGASVGAGASHDYSEISAHSISEHFLHTLTNMHEMMMTPAFEEKEVEKEKKALIAAIKSKRENIFTVTQENLNHHLFKDHPYSRSTSGTESTVSQLMRDEIQQWHKTLMSPQGALLSIATNHEYSILFPELERLFGQKNWPSKKTSLLKPIEKTTRPEKSSRHFNKTHFEQAFLMMGFNAPDVLSDEFVPLKILGGILGGGMSARLFQNLREKEGLAYDVGAYYPTRKSGSGLMIYMGLQFSRMEEAKSRILKEIDLLQKGPVSQNEFLQAVNFLKGTFILDHQTNSQRAHYQGWWEILGLPLKFDDLYPQLMDKTTADDVFNVTKKLFNNPSITIETHPKNA